MSNAGCILVKDIPRGLSSEVIKQYFFSRGGEIKAFQSYENGRKAILEFEDSTVVAGILSASHKIGRHVVTVSCVNETEHAEPITEQTVPAHNVEVKMVERVLVSGITDAKTQGCHIQQYLTSLTIAAKCIAIRMYGDQAAATFVPPIDIHSLKQACERSPCSNNPNISLSALSLPTHVLMKGLPQATPAFAIRLYMEKMGADVTDVNMLPSNEALVAFASHSGVRAVIESPNPVLGDVVISIEEYFPHLGTSDEQTDFSVQQEEKRCVKYELPEWKALAIAKSEAIREIESVAATLGVKIILPVDQAPVSNVEVVGWLSAVLQIVQRLESLKKLIHVSSKTLHYTPGMWAVLQSMEAKIRILEHDCKTAVTVSATCSSCNSVAVAGINQVAFTATLNQCRIEVCFGNFTQYSSATTIVNILTQDVNQQYLSRLVQSGGGKMYDDILGRLKELSACELPQVFETKPHNLKIKKLVHCTVLKWNGGKGREVHVLEEALSRAVVCSAPPCVVISPSTLPPIQYPPVVVAEALIKVIENHDDLLDISGVTFALYVEAPDDGKAIERLFQQRHIVVKFNDIYKQMKTSSIHDSLNNKYVKVSMNNSLSFISVIKGNLFQQKVQACVISTNPDLDLSRGMLSRQLLQLVGPKIQEECNEYAPLPIGQVAVTAAHNMCTDFILHVALPMYKSKGSERTLREAIQNILQICLNRNMTSIAIPSLGAGKLGYPHHIIADILFTEVLVFNQQHPAFLQKVVFVLSEKEIYESFMKVYVQQLCVCSSEEVEPLQMEGKVGVSQKMSTRLFMQHGNIEDEKVDVIVNPTTHNADLSSNAVSRAISKKAGKGLQALCCQLSENGVVLNEKNSVFTKASGQLHCKKVLHVYTPIKDPAQTDDNDVNSIVQSVALDALSRTEKEGYKSMALPLLGFGYPVEGRAMAVIKACLEFGQSVPLSMNQIILVVSNECHFEKVCSCLTALKGDSSALEEGERENYVLEVRPHSQMASKHVFRTLQPWTVADLKTLENKDAVVKAYSVFPEQSHLVIQEIESNVMSELITDCIDDDFIQHLIASEEVDITHCLSELGVVIDWKKEKKKILLSGEKNKVREAQTVVTKILNSLRHASMMLNQVVWQKESENDIQLYPKDVSSRLEMALIKKVRWLEVQSVEDNVVIDLEKMLEIDRGSGKTCCVQRVEKVSHIEFPPYWQPQPMEHGQEKPCHMVNVASNTEEYRSAIKEFKETMYGFEFSILSLERIQNSNEYTKHCAFLDVLKRRHGGQVLLKRLFHGTSASSVQAIAHQGFNRIFAADANAALFGKGVYFAARANYSAQEKYAVPDQCGNQKMFICHVVVGKYTKGEKSMKIAPPLDASKNKHLLFDTLVDNPANPTIYVVMSDSQAYPEYLVTFRSKRKV